MAGDGHESGGAIAAAFAANMGIAVTKFAGFIITGSSSLLAESIHSVADSSNQGLLFLGGRQATRAPDELHQFGHGRVRYFWAFVVSVVLFSLGGLFSVYEGYHKIHDPHEIDSPAVAIGILARGLRPRVLRAAHRGQARHAAAREAELAAVHQRVALAGAAHPAAGGLGRADRPGVRAAGRLARGDHRRAGLRRHRHARHRPRAVRHRLRAGARDAQPADRRIRRAGARAPDRRRVRARTRGPPRDPHAHAAHRPGRDPDRGQGRVRPGPDDQADRRRDQRRRGARARDPGVGTARIYVEPDIGPAETVAEAAAPAAPRIRTRRARAAARTGRRGCRRRAASSPGGASA